MQNLLYVSAFTVFQAICSTAIALIIGLSSAYFTANRSFLCKKYLLSLSAVPFCIPSLLIALGFVSFFGLSGTLNTFLKKIFSLSASPLTFLYSFWGIIIVQGFYNFPLVMATVHDAWSVIPTEQQEAARILGGSEWRIFRTVTFFQILPAIASSCMLVFLYCFFSFVIVLLFGGLGRSTLEVEIYKSARVTLDFSETIRLAVCESSLAAFFVAVYSKLEQKSSKIRGISFKRSLEKIRSVPERLFSFVIFFLIAIFFLAPILSILYNGFSSSRDFFTLKTFFSVVKMRMFVPSLLTTIITAIFTASLCVAIAFLYASFLRSVDLHGKNLFLKVLPMIPMCVSSVVTGVVIIFFVKKGSYIHLILAQVFLTWPFAFRQIYSSISKIGNETVESAKILSANPLNLVFRIYFPSCKRAILSSAGFCFAISAGDTTLPLVLAIPKLNTLSLFTYRLASSYRFHEACAAGMILGILCTIVFALGDKIKENRKTRR